MTASMPRYTHTPMLDDGKVLSKRSSKGQRPSCRIKVVAEKKSRGCYLVRARPGFLFWHLDSELNLLSLKLAQTLALGGNGELPSEQTEQVGLLLALISTAERECGTVLGCRGQSLSWMEGR